MQTLSQIAEAARKEQLTKSIFSKNNPYNESNSRAVSDGDEHGKGGSGKSVGSSKDISERTVELNKNIYNSNNQYKGPKD